MPRGLDTTFLNPILLMGPTKCHRKAVKKCPRNYLRHLSFSFRVRPVSQVLWKLQLRVNDNNMHLRAIVLWYWGVVLIKRHLGALSLKPL